jgi:hypothetical protein
MVRNNSTPSGNMNNSATTVLNVLDGKYGTLEPDFPTDPYQFIVWWYCGYPQSQKACAKGWASLTRATKIEPDDLLRAPPGRLTEALRPGSTLRPRAGRKMCGMRGLSIR